ncbi:MAG TPA: hydrogenase maturation protease [Ktedonobacteraceae bacterium]|nr:hydrogenase maturation protease [Ktedonobacteraceae bacterium]
MNASASLRPLILGIGNPLRSDDGLGQAVAERLAQAVDLDCDIRTVQQLTPELAQYLAGAGFVIMIDASREGEPGAVRISSLALSTLQPTGGIGAHHLTPEDLARFTTALYGRCPPVMIISVTGVNFELGEHLSPIVAGQVSHISTVLCKICAGRLSTAGTLL